jgi:hypothetical protein
VTPPNPQPVLPAEGAYTETERLFIAEEPPSTFPGNQHSNWGLLRRVITDEMQIAVDDLNSLFNEIFIDTASAYLSDWEREMGLPVSAVLSDAARRSTLASRRTRAPFTRSRIRSLIERYISDTFGTPAEFGSAGIALTGAGIPLYAEAGPVPTLYRVYEDVRGFAYTIRVKNTVTPSAALARELTWMTPAHIAFTYDNTLANILNYGFEIRNSQPIGEYKLVTVADASGYANPGTANGGVALGGVAGLISSPDVDAATTFDGADDYISVPDFASSWPFSSMTVATLSLEAWVKPTALPTAGNYKMAVSKGVAFLGIKDAAGTFVFNVGGADLAAPSGAAVNGVYHLVGTYDGTTARLYVNGALVASGARAVGSLTGLMNIGRRVTGTNGYFTGVLDEVAIYDRALKQSEITLHYNTGINVA